MAKQNPWKSGILIVIGLVVLRMLGSLRLPTRTHESSNEPPSVRHTSNTRGNSRPLNVVANLVALALTSVATVTVAIQQADASKIESVSAVGGYLAAAISGPFILNVDCDAFATLKHEHRWDCTAGIEWDNGRKWHKEYPALNMPRTLPASFVVYAVNSRASLMLLPSNDRGLNPPVPGLVRKGGAGKLGTANLDEQADGYTAVGLSVGDAKQCTGFVIRDQELETSEGLPIPNNCSLRFTVSMPPDSIASNSGTFAFNSIEFNTRSARSAYDDESVMAALGIYPKFEGRDKLPRKIHYSEYLIGVQRLYVHLIEAPVGWAPTLVNPRPVGASPAVDRPEWEYLGASPSSFYISASGSIPVHESDTVRIFLLGALVGVLGSLVASSVLAVLQAFDRR